MKRAIFTLLTVAIGVLVVAGSVLLLNKRQAEPPTISAKVVGTQSTPQGTLPHATLEMSIYPNSSSAVPGPKVALAGVSTVADTQAWPFYWPSSTLQMPAHSVVTMTVHEYDSGETIYNPWLATVSGTLDGTATYDGKAMKAIDPKAISHTFTIHNFSESTQPTWFVNIPFPAQPDDAPTDQATGYPTKPIDITFSFVTGAPGTYVWNCEFPCGTSYVSFGGPMSQRGWMSGTVEVV